MLVAVTLGLLALWSRPWPRGSVRRRRLGGGFWTFMGTFDINKAGFVIVGMFVLTWAVALSVWHFGKIEQKWDTAKAAVPD